MPAMVRNKWVQTFILYITCVIAWTAVDPSRPESAQVSVIVAYYLGAGVVPLTFGLFVALLPAALHRLSVGEWPSWQIWLAAPFMVIFIYLAHIGTAAAEQAIAEKSRQYSTPSCDFVVEFPEKPSIRQGGTETERVEQANLVLTEKEVLLRAECARLREPGLEQDWVQNMKRFMKADGMEPISVEQENKTIEGAPVIVAKGSAFKELSEGGAVVNMRVIATDGSFLILYAMWSTDRELPTAAWEFLRDYSVIEGVTE